MAVQWQWWWEVVVVGSRPLVLPGPSGPSQTPPDSARSWARADRVVSLAVASYWSSNLFKGDFYPPCDCDVNQPARPPSWALRWQSKLICTVLTAPRPPTPTTQPLTHSRTHGHIPGLFLHQRGSTMSKLGCWSADCSLGSEGWGWGVAWEGGREGGGEEGGGFYLRSCESHYRIKTQRVPLKKINK